MGNKAVALAALLLLAALPMAVVAQPLLPFQQEWISLALIVIFMMYMIVAILYMAATGFNMPGLVAWCKNELFQITATAIMVFALVIVLTGIDAATRGLVGQEALQMYDVQPDDFALMKVGQQYMLCQSNMIWSSYNYLIVTTAPLAIIYSSTIHIRPLKMGFSIQPAKFIQPIMDNVNIAVNMLQTGAWASKAMYVIMLFAQDVMFTILLPLGIVLRSIPFTRSIGGALIAIAVAFYVALPAATLINAVVYREHYGVMCDPHGGLTGTVMPRLQALGGGTWHYLYSAFNAGTGGLAPAIFGKAGGWSYLLLGLAFGGSALGAAAYVMSGVVVGLLISAMLAWAREITFMIVILTFVGGVVDYMITFTFARELSKVLGADVDLTSLLKIL